MKLTSPFILLLGSIFSLSLEANAVPLKQRGIVSLPLKRVPTQEGLHPQLLLQQHINRSHRRLARMTGRQEPSDEQLLKALISRDEHLFGRSTTHLGLAPRVLNKQGSSSVPGKASARDAAELVASTGFSSVDLSALEAGDTLTDANKPSTANTLGLDIEANDAGYCSTVQMGTPPRDFTILMDSGSADLWVVGEACESSTTEGANCGNHTVLGPQSSSSFVDTDQIFQVIYGLGQVSGDIITDNIAVAGLKLANHTFGVASAQTDNFATSPCDGIMGLGQSTLSKQQTLTPVESLAKAGSIKEAITSFKIPRLADQKNDGQVTFGALDTTKFDQATLVTLQNQNTQGFWEGSVDAVTVDGKDLGLTGRTAILDTGTSLLIVPSADATTIHNALPGAKSDGNGGFTVPCTLSSSLALTFGGKPFAIDPRDITFSPVDPSNLTGDCVSGISSGQIGGANEWLAGDVLLKNAYFSTNVDKNTIQLAKLT